MLATTGLPCPAGGAPLGGSAPAAHRSHGREDRAQSRQGPPGDRQISSRPGRCSDAQTRAPSGSPEEISCPWSPGPVGSLPGRVGAGPSGTAESGRRGPFGAGTGVRRLHPAGELAADVRRIDVPGQQEPGPEDGLAVHDFEEILESHGSNVARMASCCNESAGTGSLHRGLFFLVG